MLTSATPAVETRRATFGARGGLEKKDICVKFCEPTASNLFTPGESEELD
jgi:hypothetical protein